MQGVARISALFALSVAVAGCNTTGQRMGALPGQRASIAFEFIDGPPPAVFQKLVQKLNEEAEARQVPVVTREGYAPYRVRGYYAVGIEKRRTVVSWVWDVYDAEARRNVRLSGEEKSAPLGRRDAWAAASDELLGRAARHGMEQLAAFMGPAASPPVPPTPDTTGPQDRPPVTVAAADDFRPEAAGIFRLFGAPSSAPAEASAAVLPNGSEVPLPRRRPLGARDRVALAAPMDR